MNTVMNRCSVKNGKFVDQLSICPHRTPLHEVSRSALLSAIFLKLFPLCCFSKKENENEGG